MWPFPSAVIRAVADQGIPLLTVELNTGQMVEDVRLSVEGKVAVGFAGYPPGYLPSPDDVYQAIIEKLPSQEQSA